MSSVLELGDLVLKVSHLAAKCKKGLAARAAGRQSRACDFNNAPEEWILCAELRPVCRRRTPPPKSCTVPIQFSHFSQYSTHFPDAIVETKNGAASSSDATIHQPVNRQFCWRQSLWSVSQPCHVGGTVAHAREGVRNTSGFIEKRQARGVAHLGLHHGRHMPHVGTSLHSILSASGQGR